MPKNTVSVSPSPQLAETFEAASCWRYGGIQPPYYGAFGEAYDLGVVTIERLSLWFPGRHQHDLEQDRPELARDEEPAGGLVMGDPLLVGTQGP